jgi:hypothetical protein
LQPVLSYKNEFSESRKRELLQIEAELLIQGFVPVDAVPPTLRTSIVDPLYIEHPARAFRITGVNSGQKGSRKFKCVDLFGVGTLHESYFIVDWDRFSKFISAKLEAKFVETNPDTPKQLRKVFTRFMHNFGLHWSGCQHVIERLV